MYPIIPIEDAGGRFSAHGRDNAQKRVWKPCPRISWLGKDFIFLLVTFEKFLIIKWSEVIHK
jgi:hypothetical protein